MDFAAFSRLADRVVELSKAAQYRKTPPKDPTGWEPPTAKRKSWKKPDRKQAAPEPAPAAPPMDPDLADRIQRMADRWGLPPSTFHGHDVNTLARASRAAFKVIDTLHVHNRHPLVIETLHAVLAGRKPPKLPKQRTAKDMDTDELLARIEQQRVRGGGMRDLGLTEKVAASRAKFEAWYRDMARRLHPDRVGSRGERAMQWLNRVARDMRQAHDDDERDRAARRRPKKDARGWDARRHPPSMLTPMGKSVRRVVRKWARHRR